MPPQIDLAVLFATITILSSAAILVDALASVAIAQSFKQRQSFVRSIRAPCAFSHHWTVDKTSPKTTALLFAQRVNRGFIHSSSNQYSLVNRPTTISTTTIFTRRRRKSLTTLPRAMSLSNDDHHTASFANFLHSVPEDLSDRIKIVATNGLSPVRMIMGNEAGDADSIISSLGLAHANSIISPADQNETSIPLVSIPRADMSLRRDAVLLLDLAGINADNLLYIDDEIVTNHLLSLTQNNSDLSPQEVPNTITLVDHNRIRSSLSHLSSAVTEIVDHHEDEHSHEHVTSGSGKRIIAFDNSHATVASTCTLVAERLFQAMDEPTMKVDGGLGLALLGVILLDSVNMLPEAGKGTARDEEAMQALLERTDWSSCADITPSFVDAATLEKLFPNGRDSMPDRTALFEVLSNSKFDPKFWSEMSVMDCLRIDYKKFMVTGKSPLMVPSIGLSSVLLDMDAFLSKKNIREELSAFMFSEDVGLFGILSLQFEDGKSPQRELLLTGSNPEIVDSFANYLLHHPDAAFLDVMEREHRLSDGEGQTCDEHSAKPIRVFRQGNSKGSRKQVAPVLISHASTFSRL